MESPGQWLDKALSHLCQKMESGLALDSDMISGLVSYCDRADPTDAKEYLDNIIGQETGRTVIEEYLRRRGHSDPYHTRQDVPSSQFHAYVKPPSESSSITVSKKPLKTPKVNPVPNPQTEPKKAVVAATNTKKKKSGKVISLAEAAKGSIVFQQGKPCLCQARKHRLISNCLSCGKIVCEQEGEGPCKFCGALVLMEGSQYAGLDQTMPVISDSEAKAEAFAKRLVDYDRNSAARTTVIDDQSDYYEIEGNGWLSIEEKELLRKKREAIEEEEKAKRNRVVVTFDLVGRKVLVNKDEVDELESVKGILRPSDERELHRVKPNPTVKIQPIFTDPGPMKKNVAKSSGKSNKTSANGLCLEITGRVQHESNELKYLTTDGSETGSTAKFWQAASSSSSGIVMN